MLKKFFNQTRRPEGFGGRLMINMMNIGHGKLATWGMSHIKPGIGDKVLDIGCGGGKNIEHWLKLCYEGTVVGIDYSLESVKKSAILNQSAIDEDRCRIVEGNVMDMPFEDCQFDIVSAFETIYFWPNIEKAFAEVSRVLKPGGHFMIVNEICDGRGQKWEDMIEGMKVYKKSDLIQLLEGALFDVDVVDVKESSGWITLIASKRVVS